MGSYQRHHLVIVAFATIRAAGAIDVAAITVWSSWV
jgi:hypothetical protein